MWLFRRNGPSGFSSSSTAEEVTNGIDGSGLTAIVTGASSGIGSETARVLALRGVNVIMGVRNMVAGKKVKEAIVKEIPAAKVDIMELDLSSLASVRKFASEFTSSGRPLNLLINNAGMASPFELSEDNIELHFATNHLGTLLQKSEALSNRPQMCNINKYSGDEIGPHTCVAYDEVIACNIYLKITFTFFDKKKKKESCFKVINPDHLKFQIEGHFLLTHLLIETMKKTAREMKKEGRIVNVSSEAHRYTYKEGIRFERLNDKEGYKTMAAYGQSKLANILHCNELARRLKEDGEEITANSLHPGAITTNLFRGFGVFKGAISIVGKFLLKDIPQGASTSCYVALHPQVKGISGEYFSDNNLAKPSSKAADADLSKKLWDFSMDLIK